MSVNNIITLQDKYIEYYLGYRCNLRCTYCGVNKEDEECSNGIDKFEEVLKNNKYFNSEKLKKIILSGGEVTLFRKEVLEILEKYSHKYTFLLISNAVEIDTLLEYCKYPIEVTVSYDGHNNDRGFDSFENLKNVHKTGRLKGINVTISNSNYKDLYKTCKEIIELYPDLISDEIMNNDNQGLKIEIVRQVKEFYNFDYEIFREQLTKLYREISPKLHLFTKHTGVCGNFWEYENDLVCNHGTGDVDGKGCFQTVNNLETVIYEYEKYCRNCKNTICYAYGCPVTGEVIGGYKDHPYCKLNSVLQEVIEYERKRALLLHHIKTTNYIELILTENCNMACKHCFEKDFIRNKNVMTKETLDLIFDYFIKEDNDKVFSINLFGGEPIMPSTLEIRNYLVKKIKESKRKVEVSVVSNTFSITDEDLQWLKDIKDAAYYFSWQTSIDSIEEYNDKSRITINGNGTFNQVFENLKKISPIIGKEYININSVVTFENINGLAEWGKFLTDNIFNKYACACSFRTDQTRVQEMDLKERCIVSEEYNKVIEYYRKGLIAPEIVRKIFNIQEGFYRFKNQKTEFVPSCGICNGQFTINYNGGLLVCHSFTDDMIISNLKTKYISDDIYKIYDTFSSPTEQYNAKTKELCSECNYRFNCIRCKLTHYTQNGDVNIVSPFTCEYVKQISRIFEKYLWYDFYPLTPEEREEFKLDLLELQKLHDEDPANQEIIDTIYNMYKIRRERIW
jgi:uncharacterized protein